MKIILKQFIFRLGFSKNTKMYRILHISLIGILFTLIMHPVSAQRNEFGLFGGGSFYIGDINPKTPFAQTKIAYGGLYRYNFNPHWALKFNVYRGELTSSDAVIKSNEKRNLHFRSDITEVSVNAELNFFPYQTGNKKMMASPYVFAGLAYFKFNPQAEFEGTWYDLQPLGTEGQGTSTYSDKKPYSLGGFAIPFGVGAKLSLGKSFCLGFEWGMRKTFTDYIDDISTTYADPVILAAENTPISAVLADRTIFGIDEEPYSNVGKQRGDSSTNDWYSFAGVTVTFKIRTGKSSCEGMSSSRRKYREYKYD